MKRFTVCILAIALVVGTAHATVTTWINRVEESGRLLVPVRGVFEALGASVDWSSYDMGVTVFYQGRAISMWVNNPEAMIESTPYYLDVPPRNIGGHVYIPLRFVGEAMGKAVDYHGDRVVISSGGSAELILMIRGSGGAGTTGAVVRTEMVAASNDRYLTNADCSTSATGS